MKKKNTNIEKTSNRDILKNKIIQLNEAVFVKKMDLKISIFIPPLLWIGIPLLGEIISFFIITVRARRFQPHLSSAEIAKS